MSAGFDRQGDPAKQAGFGLRASDAERDATVAELREHYAAGRLTTDELNERIGQAFGAKTRGDLNAIMRDLPSTRPAGTPLADPGQPSSGAGWTGQDWTAGRDWAGHDWSRRGPGWNHGTGPGGPQGPWGPGRAIGAVVSAVVALCLLSAFGIMAVTGTGLGGGRPIGIVLLLAAFALLRRLVFGRSRRARRARRARAGRGPRRR
jgi:hypothetical protein